MKKRIMLLGGARYLLPVIEAAHALDMYVITCDYLPDNIAHKYSDEYANVSIIDKEAVLQKAKELQIDGITSFACDPGVTTAAYVAEQMGLPAVAPYESVCILQNKQRFRRFLAENGFNVPYAKGYTCVDEAIKDVSEFRWPVIVKPTDSAGSKGVNRVDDPADLEKSIRYALSFSHCGEFIVEEFLEKKGHSSDTDCFCVDGELRFVSFSAQRFDEDSQNPYTPAAYSWPATISKENCGYLTSELQRLMTLLRIRTSIFNVEVRECTDDKAYIMECSPRGGGNRLAEVLRYATGEDLITNTVLATVGEPVNVKQAPYNGNWAEIILHSKQPGVFRELVIHDTIKESVVETDLWILPGTVVGGFAGANEAIGTLILKFEEESRMREVLDNIDDYVQVQVDMGG